MIKTLKSIHYLDELSSTLFKAKSGFIGSNLLGPIVLAFALKDFVPIYLLAVWLFTLVVIFLFRLQISKRALYLLKHHKGTSIKPLLVRYLWLVFFNALLLGISGFFTLLYADNIHTLLILLGIVIIVTGSLSTLTPVYHAVFIFITTTLLTWVLAFVILGTTTFHLLLFFILLAYLIIVLPASFRIFSTIESNIIQAQTLLINTKKMKEKDQQLMQQVRLAQMGELLSMIAHQWRQPLSAIASRTINLELKFSLESFDLDTKEGQIAQNDYFSNELTQINLLVSTLSSTIDDFRNFYKPNKDKVYTSLEKIVKKSLNIIEALLDTNHIDINYTCVVADKILVYDTQIMQVVLNILKNAEENFREKMIQNPKIFIYIDGKVLTICDNGGGIKEDIIEEIFDPYFTTKDKNNGTGIGLYMSRMMIQQHHQGSLTVHNNTDGVCFKVTLF